MNNTSTTTTFPAALRAELARQGITQTELARRLGIAPPRISEYLNGTQLPSLSRLREIADALNVPAGALPEGWKGEAPEGVWF